MTLPLREASVLLCDLKGPILGPVKLIRLFINVARSGLFPSKNLCASFCLERG